MLIELDLQTLSGKRNGGTEPDQMQGRQVATGPCTLEDRPVDLGLLLPAREAIVVPGQTQQSMPDASNCGPRTQKAARSPSTAHHLQPTMEAVHFMVASQAGGDTDDHPNVTTTRGSLPTSPLRLSSSTTLDEFVAAASRPYEQPLLPTTHHNVVRALQSRRLTPLLCQEEASSWKLSSGSPTPQRRHKMCSCENGG